MAGTVVHLVPAMEQGGVESVVCDLNRAAVRAGWRSIVISRGGRLVDRITSDGGEHVALDLKSKNPLTYLTRAWKLRKVINNRIIEWSNDRIVEWSNDRMGAASRRGDVRDVRGDGDGRLIVCAHSRVPAWLYVGARKIDSIIRKFDNSSIFQLPFVASAKLSSIGHAGRVTLPRVRGRGERPAFITYAHGANSVSRYSAVMTFGDRVIVPSKFLAGYLIENYAGETAERSETAEGRATAGKTNTKRSAVGRRPYRVKPSVGRDVLGAPRLQDRIRVIYPAVDFGRFDPAKVDSAAVAALRREWGVRDGERVEMSIGRITAVKGFDNVIRDFAANAGDAGEIAERSETAEGRAPAGKTLNDKLVIVGGVDKGKEPVLDGLKKLAAELGVADRVVFAGARGDIPTCLAVADEVVSGNVTKPESFGLSVAEALAMGKPVRLLRNFGGAGEILEECGRWNAREQNGDAAAGRARRPATAEEPGRARRPATAEERREAIRALCDFGIMWRKTEKVYEELLK